MGLVFLGIAAQRALRGKQGGMGEGEGGPPRRYVPFGPNLIAGAWIILLLAA
jgi:prepilin signal peptidase PulO-like enzyme (type II secretory pathway)